MEKRDARESRQHARWIFYSDMPGLVWNCWLCLKLNYLPVAYISKTVCGRRTQTSTEGVAEIWHVQVLQSGIGVGDSPSIRMPLHNSRFGPYQGLAWLLSIVLASWSARLSVKDYWWCGEEGHGSLIMLTSWEDWERA